MIFNKKTGQLERKILKKLYVDKINNDGDHSLLRTNITDYQLLCPSCNRIKNPIRDLEQISHENLSLSEVKNLKAEKPMMEWLLQMLQKGEEVEYEWFIRNAAFNYDVTPKTIKNQYVPKYFQTERSPFETYTNLEKFNSTYIRLKESWEKLQDMSVNHAAEIVKDYVRKNRTPIHQ